MNPYAWRMPTSFFDEPELYHTQAKEIRLAE